MTRSEPLHFRARTIRGAGRGKRLEVPTLNFRMADAPMALDEGIYACRLTADGVAYPGAMHYGPRPVFNDAPSLEVHVIGAALAHAPAAADIEIVERLRDVRNFDSPEDLRLQMAKDIAQARAILGA